MPTKFLPFGEGGVGVSQKGVEVPIIFLWAWGFSEQTFFLVQIWGGGKLLEKCR